MVWCRGTVKGKIFEPWIDFMRTKGCEILEGRRVTDFSFDEETSCISEVICGRELYNADAVILAVGISRLQELIKNRCAVFSGICTLTLLSLLTWNGSAIWIQILACYAIFQCSIYLQRSGERYYNQTVSRPIFLIILQKQIGILL